VTSITLTENSSLTSDIGDSDAEGELCFMESITQEDMGLELFQTQGNSLLASSTDYDGSRSQILPDHGTLPTLKDLSPLQRVLRLLENEDHTVPSTPVLHLPSFLPPDQTFECSYRTDESNLGGILFGFSVVDDEETETSHDCTRGAINSNFLQDSDPFLALLKDR
jgi:hypothetical protein